MILVGLFGSKNVTYQRDARIRLTVFNVRANLSTEKQNMSGTEVLVNKSQTTLTSFAAVVSTADGRGRDGWEGRFAASGS